MPARKHSELMKQYAEDDSLVAWLFDPSIPNEVWELVDNPLWLDDLIYELHPSGVTPNWIVWNGGERPVHPESFVKCIYKDGFTYESCAGNQNWAIVICYRCIKEHVPHVHQKWIDMAKADPTIKWEFRNVAKFWNAGPDEGWIRANPCWCERHEYRPIQKTRTVRKWLWNIQRPEGIIFADNIYLTEDEVKTRWNLNYYKIHSRTDQYIDVEEPVNG